MVNIYSTVLRFGRPHCFRCAHNSWILYITLRRSQHSISLWLDGLSRLHRQQQVAVLTQYHRYCSAVSLTDSLHFRLRKVHCVWCLMCLNRSKNRCHTLLYVMTVIVLCGSACSNHENVRETTCSTSIVTSDRFEKIQQPSSFLAYANISPPKLRPSKVLTRWIWRVAALATEWCKIFCVDQLGLIKPKIVL